VASGIVLLGVWAAAFGFTGLAFFPLIAIGGIVTGLAGLWVRTGTVAVLDDAEAGRPDAAAARALPRWSLTRSHALLAVAVAAVHLVLAHVLFDLGSFLLPHLAPTAEQVYGRTGEVTLWWALLLGGAVTAPLEEVYWRGAIHPLLTGVLHVRLPRAARVPGATLVTGAVVYALFHVSTGSAALVAAALLGGLVWGWLQERTGSLGTPMLAHALWACGMLALPPL
jgi:membrane protease YdiL (CAAX protease family)